MKTLYQIVLENGIEHCNHCSDLYLPVNDKTRKLILEYKYKQNVTIFISRIDKKLWYDVPFAYDIYWKKKNSQLL